MGVDGTSIWRRAGLGGALLLTVGLGLWVLVPVDEPPEEQPAIEVPAARAVEAPSPPPPAAVEEPPLAVGEPLTEEQRKALTVGAFELITDYTGEGLIECVVPEDAGPRNQLPNAERHGNVLVVRVEEAAGSMRLVGPSTRPPLDPADRLAWREENARAVLVAEWTGAHPGQWGTCTVKPAEVRILTGRVDFLDGQRACRQVEGCGTVASVAPDGTFEMAVAVAGACSLRACNPHGGAGGGVFVDPLAPPQPLIVPEPHPEDEIEASREELAALQGQPRPLEMALEATTDPGMKAVIRTQAWMAKMEQRRRMERLSLGLQYADERD